MGKLNESFIEKFKLEQLLIFRVGSWIISLRPQQPTIGSMVLTLDRSCEHLGELSEDEAKDLGTAYHEIEKLLDKTFKPDRINYLALMMVDNQVHFHVIPRYGKAVEINGMEYQDKNWPGPPSLDPLEIESSTLDAILDSLKRFS